MREKRKLIYFSERKNNQELEAAHPLQDGRNAKEEYATRIQDIKYNSTNSSRTEMYRRPIIPAVNMPNERAVSSGISQEILPRNCQRKKGL